MSPEKFVSRAVSMRALFILTGLLLIWPTPRVGGIPINVYLDKDAQGRGNKGILFRPIDEFEVPAIFELTARTMVDESEPCNPDASSAIGTIYIDKSGAGVQTIDGNGSTRISGKGEHQNEDLTFTFDSPICADYISLGLTKVDLDSNGLGFKRNAPVLFLSDAANPGVFEYTVLEQQLAEHFTRTGKKKGFVDFSLLDAAIPDNLTIDSFTIRETDGHLAVDLITIAIPEPITVFLFGLGGLPLLRKFRNR